MSSFAFREAFPTIVANPEQAYLDSAALTQLPQPVIDCLNQYHTQLRTNIGRGMYDPALKMTEQVAGARATLARFLHAPNTQEVVFTSGTTAGMELILNHWALQNLQNGDEILLGKNDHRSIIEPWQRLQKILAERNVDITLKYFEVDIFGEPKIEQITALANRKTKLLVLTHLHNVFGTDAEVKTLRAALGPEILIALDATQSASHLPLNVVDLGVNFLLLSGHKMFADTGIGVLWIDAKLHTQLAGWSKEKPWPAQFLEKGTPHIPGILSLQAAVGFIQTMGQEKIHERLVELTQYLLQQLRTMPNICFLPGIANCRCYDGSGIVSFRVEGISSQDIGFFLNEQGIFVRTGDHCTVGDEISDSIRVSMQIYNTEEEIDRLIEALKSIRA